ncbi:MAG TPA: hypothetical protein VGM01_00675 [Ktedonobacteraceae bacterium]|jgi:hypothetical protein
MQEMVCTVTLWLAWYRERAEQQDLEEKEQPRRLLRLKMVYASSQEEARVEIQQWLERRGLLAQDLMRLEPSPYGLQFQALKVAAL